MSVICALIWIFLQPEPGLAGSFGTIRISEIHAAPSVSALEFVEVINAGSEAVDLSGLTLADARDRPSAVALTDPVLPAGARIVLVRDSPEFAAVWPGVAHVPVAPWPALNNDGDMVSVAVEGVVLDRVPYDQSWGAHGRSLERRDPHGPSGHPVNWGPSTDPSGATPGRQNTLYAPDREPPTLLFADRPAPDTVAVRFDEPVDASSATFRLDGAPATVARSVDRERTILLAVDPGTVDGTLHAAGVLDLFGNRAGEAYTPVAHIPQAQSLRITEAFTRPSGATAGRFRFVEVASASDRVQSLRFLRLGGPVDAYGESEEAAVPLPPWTLAPGERAVFVDPEEREDAEARFRAAWSTALEARLVFMDDWPLGSDPSAVRLLARTEPVDEVALSADWHDPSLPVYVRRSLERIDPDRPGTQPADWSSSRALDGGTPGTVNSVESTGRGRPPGPGDLRITEVMFEPLSGAMPARPEFVEIGSTAGEGVDPNGAWLVNRVASGASDSVRIGFGPDALRSGEAVVLTWSVPGAAPYEAHARLVDAYPGSADHTSANRVTPAVRARALSNDGGTLTLRGPAGLVLDSVRYHRGLHHPALAHTAGVSIERVDWSGPSDAPSNWSSSTHADGGTPGYRPRTFEAPDPTAAALALSARVFAPGAGSAPDHLAIRVALVEGPGVLDVTVYDLDGRPVRTLANGLLTHGQETVYWNGLDDRGILAPVGPYIVLARSWVADGRSREARAVAILGR